MNDLLKMNLQMFADETNPEEKPADTPPDETPPADDVPPEETYTKAQMEEIINKRVIREKKAAEKAIAESEKLAKMNLEEKDKYEKQQLLDKIAEYERKDQVSSLSKEASNMFADKGIKVNDNIISQLIKDTAEDTQAVVNDFITMYQEDIQAGVKQALSGNAPRVNTNNKQGITKKDFDSMGYKDKVALNQTNPELYKQLTKGD